MGNRPDCAYFLLLGLCGAAFLLAIGGILTFNLTLNSNSNSQFPHPHSHFHQEKTATAQQPTIRRIGGQASDQHQTGHNEKEEKLGSSEPGGDEALEGHESEKKTVDSSSKSGLGLEGSQLVLAIIGPLCLLLGALFLLLIAFLGLKYDCDYEPEPEVAFLRLKSELSLNFDPDKNNYELLRRVPTLRRNEGTGRDDDEVQPPIPGPGPSKASTTDCARNQVPSSSSQAQASTSTSTVVI